MGIPLHKPTPPQPDWQAIIRAHGHRVLVAVLAMGLRVDRAKEVAQAAWLRLIDQQRDGQLPDMSFPGLAIAQARFLALDELRRQKRDARHRLLLEPAPDGAVSPEGRLLHKESLQRALATLQGCPANAQRIVALLYEQPGLSHAECAARVGLSVQRVRQILCETRQKVRSAIEAEGSP